MAGSPSSQRLVWREQKRLQRERKAQAAAAAAAATAAGRVEGKENVDCGVRETGDTEEAGSSDDAHLDGKSTGRVRKWRAQQRALAVSRGNRECSLHVKQRVARQLGEQFLSNTASYTSSCRKDILALFGQLPLLKGYRSEHTQTAKDSHLAAMVLRNVKDACTTLKDVQFGDHLRARNTLFNIILSEDIQGSHLVSSLSRQIGVSRRQIYRAMNSRQAQDRGELSPWLGAGRKTRCDIVSGYVKDSIVPFWELASRPSSNTKDTKRFRTAPKTFIKHIMHFLDMSQEAHAGFLSEHGSNSNCCVYMGHVFYEVYSVQ